MAARITPTGRPVNPSPQPSGQHQGLHRPSEDQRVQQALHHASLDDFGETAEDQIRDRRSRGLPATDDIRSHSDEDAHNQRY